MPMVFPFIPRVFVLIQQTSLEQEPHLALMVFAVLASCPMLLDCYAIHQSVFVSVKACNMFLTSN